MMAEIPSAQISQLLVSINSSPDPDKKITLSDFLLFKDRPESEVFPPKAAAIAIQLSHEARLPQEFIGVWPQIIESAKKNTEAPRTRAFASDCKNVFILAPEIKDGKVFGVALVKNFISGTVRIRDIDKRLHTMYVKIPQKNDYCYIEETRFQLSNIKTL
jgi:hypothetical protein